MDTPLEPMLLDIASVAQIIGLGRSKTWELVSKGEIMSVRLGTRRLVPRDAVEKFVASLVAKSAS